jgi:enterochelin esterase family protein
MIFKCLVLFAGLLPLRLAGADFSGRYSGTLDLGNGRIEPLYLILIQRGSALRGTLGPDAPNQSRFADGAVMEDVARFNFGQLSITLRLKGSAVEGEANREGRSTPDGKLAATRVAELTVDDRVPPLDYEGDDRSPRLLALRDAVARGEKDATDKFWAVVTTEGAPIVEPIPGNDRSLLVTFVWRGQAETKNVLLVRNRFTFLQPDNHFFSHIENTNIWFRTMRFLRGSRFTYTISENDPLGSRPAAKTQRKAVYDSLNPRHLPEDPKAEPVTRSSLVELPGALADIWHIKRKNTPALTLIKHKLKSEILKDERDIQVYLPPGYTKNSEARPTLYLLDGEDPDGLVFAGHTVENLIQEKKIPGIVVVRIANPNQSVRNKELSCLPEFSDFLQRELVPFIRATYKVTADPSKTGIGGYSLGGLAAVCAGLRQSKTFGLLLAQSGSFWWEPTGADGAEKNWVAKQFIGSRKLPLRFYLEAGTFEVDLRGSGGNILETSRNLRDVLLAKGYDVRYREFAGDHDYMNWRDTLGDGLIALFAESRTAEGHP